MVRSPWEQPSQAPRQGPKAGKVSVIELEPDWRPALEGLAPGRDLWVVCWLDRADAPISRVHPRNDPSRPLTGVFNTRAPCRPNPLSLTLVRLEALDGLRLTVRGLDMAEGTPVLDLKPYVAELDTPREDAP